MSSKRRIAVRNTDIISKWVYDLNRIHGMTFERMTQIEPFLGMPRGTLGAIALGEPIPNDYREQLGYARLVKVPENMVRKTPPRVGKQKYTYSYIKVRADDPDSAALTIINSQATDEYITRLAHLLTGIERKVQDE